MRAQTFASLSALSAAIFGATIMLAWMLGIRAVVQLHPDFAPTQFNTAACLALAGIALVPLDARWRRLTLTAGAAVAAIAGATAMEYIVEVDLGIDQLVVDASFVTARTLRPGRMSPQTAGVVLVVAASILAAGHPRIGRERPAVVGIGGCLIACFALTSLVGYSTGVNQTTGWLGFTRVSPQAATGLLLIGASLVARAWSARTDQGVPDWVIPAVVGTSVAVGALLFVGLRQTGADVALTVLPQVMLGGFALLGLALGAALAQYRRAAQARESAVAAKHRIESLMTQMVHTELVASLALEHTQQGVWDLDLTTGITTVDEGFRKIVGRDPLVNPLDGDTWHRAIHPDDVQVVQSKLRATVEGDGLYEAQFRVKAADGRWIWVDSRGRVVDRAANGRAIRMVGTVRDITDQQSDRQRLQLAEHALHHAQKLEAVGRLAGGVAHHINNKMMVVLGNAGILLDDASTPRQRSAAAIIEHAATETADICRQLLAYGRRQFLQPAAFDADELVERLAPSFREALGAKIRLDLNLRSRPGRCFADTSQIEWVLRNLVGNARDALHDGGLVRVDTGLVEIRGEQVSPGAAPGRYVSIAISDDGVGLSPGAAAKVFEPFYTTKDVGQGRGLGLATGYGVLKQSHGHLTVESQEGHGSTFTLLVPAID